MATDLIRGVRAAVWDGAELVVDQVSLAPPARGEVTVRVLASGICHSDLDAMDGRSRIPAPFVPGHEGAGVIEWVGEDVEHVAVGDEVMISSMTPCGDCPACRADRPSRCPSTYGQPISRFHWRGSPARSFANVSSFSSLVTVKAAQAVKTDGLPAATSALVGCAVSTGWGAVRNVAQVVPGDTVVVVGVGGIGVNAIATARATGAGRVVAVDIDSRKEPAARRFGADEFATDITTIGPVDVAIECSGAPAAMSVVLDLARTVALVGIPPPGTELRVDARSAVLGRRLLGSLNGDIVPDRDLPTILDLIRDGTLDVGAQIGGVWPLDDIHDAIAAVKAGDVVRAVIDLS